MAQLQPITRQFEEPAPVWAATDSERLSVARLVDALTSRTGLLVVRAETELATDWLTEGRVDSAIQLALMGPTEVEIWSPTHDSRIVALRFPSDSSSPMRCLEIHTLCRHFTDRLEAMWAAEIGASNPFSVTPITPLSHLDNLKDNIAELNSLLEILVNKQLNPQFQPIVSLRDGRVFGYETLIRGPKDALVRRPGQMFRVADKARVVAWFDLACLDECLKSAAEQKIRHQLFVNMDAEGLAAMAIQERPIAQRVRENGLAPTDIVIEVTERQMVGDFPRLIDDIGRLRDQGFRIAIDDAGAGYNSLRAISELRPDFVKIDRDLVKNIDVAGERSALLKALAQYAQSTGAAVVAEGAETLEELAVLIDLGIPYCQGYVLGKPNDALRGTPRQLREFIQERVCVRENKAAGADVAVGNLARPGLQMDSDTPLSEASRKFVKDPGLTSIAVFVEDRVAGLLVRQQFDHVLGLAKAAQVAEMMPAESVGKWIRTDVLRVQSTAHAREVVQQIVSRHDLALDADILVLSPSGCYEGVASVRSLMEAAANQPVRRALYCDPLTGLPGRVPLERELRARLEAKSSLAVVRIDLGQLAAVNERWGMERGNALILEVAEMISTRCARFGDETMVAHLGGDDFVVLATAEQALPICQDIVAAFLRTAPGHTVTGLPADSASRTLSPQGNAGPATLARPTADTCQTAPQCAPACDLFAAAVTNRTRRLQNPDQVFAALHDLLRSLRAQPGSRFAVDTLPGRS